MKYVAPWLLVCVMAAVGGCADAVDVDTASSEPAVDVPAPAATAVVPAASTSAADDDEASAEAEEPWDYSPYRVLVWLASDDPRVTAETLDEPLRAYLDRDFAAIWRLTVADAPATVRSAAQRQIGELSYDSITAADPVLAVKRDHREAVRIRVAENVGTFVRKVLSTKSRIEEVRRRGEQAGDPSLGGVAQRLEAIDGDALLLRQRWADPDTEAVLVSRGMALTLSNPEAKLITPPITDLVGEIVENYDKIFVVNVRTDLIPNQIDVVELDTLMRHFGPVARVEAAGAQPLSDVIGRGLIKAFSPVVRIEDAGQKSAVGLLRAVGLIIDENSPALVHPDEVLQPMVRKNDRNNDPIMIGPMDWAYLLVTEIVDREIKMDFYAGRAGGLQGRKNNRTFRMALKVRRFEPNTLLRLHAQGDPRFPLIGYEIYEKELKSTAMTFIGRTDWDGRLLIERSDDPLRLLYVKNGGAVLARLPLVPGFSPLAVADLKGDDMRLQAEAYIRGVQNAIIDLVAVRELFKARIRLRLQNGEMEQAEELMETLRNQPSNEKLATEMGKKQAAFLKAIGTREATQRRKVDEMFTTTREMLAKYINPKLVRDLEEDLIAAKKNGGKLPPDRLKDDSAEDGDADNADPVTATE